MFDQKRFGFHEYRYFALVDIRFKSGVLVTFLTVSLISLTSTAAPVDLHNFTVKNGGAIDIPWESVVEGSTAHGGIQPDYIISKSDPYLRKMILDMEQLKRRLESQSNYSRLSTNDQQKIKIKQLHSYFADEMLFRDYNSPKYLKINAAYKHNKEDIPLGEYLRIRSGVCREHALLSHLALKALGVPNKYVYGVAQVGSRSEDHAFVVVIQQNKNVIVDVSHSRQKSFRVNFSGRNQMFLQPLNHRHDLFDFIS